MIATFAGTTSFLAYSVDAFLPGFPAAGAELGAAPSTMQLTITAFLLGTAVGQLVFGAVSDRFGRRMPLLAGATVCVLASVVAALAPSIGVLVAARAFQGFAGAAGLVIGKAVLSDRSSGLQIVRHLSTMSAAAGVANIFAPILGGFLAGAAGWRASLWFLVAFSALLLVGVLFGVPETRTSGPGSGAGGARSLAAIVQHLRNRAFLRIVLVQAGSYGTLMAYVSASPYLYQDALGFDGLSYGLLFAANGAALVLANFLANRLLWRSRPERRALFALLVSIAGSAAFALAWLLSAPPWVVAALIALAVAPLGVNSPNLTGMALDRVTHSAGSAAALFGFVQFATGALVAPLVGLAGVPDPFTTMTAMVVLAIPSTIVLVGIRNIAET
jgi:DHA1 family bicyclomycin/chloramphenicol resistance-like MFS transporter